MGSVLPRQLELKLGIGGTSYKDFIRHMHLPMQLRCGLIALVLFPFYSIHLIYDPYLQPNIISEAISAQNGHPIMEREEDCILHRSCNLIRMYQELDI